MFYGRLIYHNLLIYQSIIQPINPLYPSPLDILRICVTWQFSSVIDRFAAAAQVASLGIMGLAASILSASAVGQCYSGTLDISFCDVYICEAGMEWRGRGRWGGEWEGG